MLKAKIVTTGETFNVEIDQTEQQLTNGIRNSINAGVFYEVKTGQERVLLNAKNIVALVFEATDQVAESKFAPVSVPTPEEERAMQLKMQPLIPVFEAKAEGMKELKEAEDAKKKEMYGAVVPGAKTKKAK